MTSRHNSTCPARQHACASRPDESRFADLLIAATAHANNLDLYTRNGADFAGLENLVRVIVI